MCPTSCPICGSNDQYRRICDVEKGTRQIISCKCGLQSIFPLPTQEDLRKIYCNRYYDFWGVKHNFRQVFHLKLKTCERLIRQANSLLSDPSNERRHLDIGSAFGYMIKASQVTGYASQGLEISEAADEAIKLGYNVSKVSLENAALNDECFHLITAVDVLEHIPEPKRWLEECKRILKKGGLLLLVTPDCSSLSARVTKRKWPHYKLEHLFYYSPDTLTRLLLTVGFNDVTSKRALKYLNLNYITAHYLNFQPDTIEARLLKMLTAFLPPQLNEYLLPFPSEMVVFARKA